MRVLWIRALGPLEVVVEGAPVLVGAGKPRIVLECLALRPNMLVTSDVLVEALWSDRPPATPGPQLQVYLANLRRVLDPDRSKGESSQRIVSRSGGYELRVGQEELDLLGFRARVASGELAVQAGDLVGGADALRGAVELFRGPAFPELIDIQTFRPEVDGLEETRVRAYQDLMEVELALGRHTSLVGELQWLVAQHPYRERLWASLVVTLYRADRQADALAACRDARHLFIEELGIDPGPRMQELERLVLRQDASLAAPATEGHRRTKHRLDNLPAEPTPLVGREAEVNALCSLFVVEACRLLTVTGAGGTGKTRVALAAAARLSASMADGVCWVSLAPLTHPEQVPAAIAGALGLEWPGPDPLQVATGFLRSRHLLLVLDNFEHLEGAWSVVFDLLTAAPNLRVLITSRRPLEVRAEHEYELPPLTLPPLDPTLPLEILRAVPAVKLFLARGRAVRTDFDVTSDNAGTVARICHRLDGLPLALELAAAQLRHHSERVLLADLEVSLSALPAAFRDLPDRQRTLTATIAWSYQLLGDKERCLLEELGVFAGNPTVAAAASISSAGPRTDSIGDLLTVLARHSLLRLYTDATGETRVPMLHSIREFTRDRLNARADATALHRRHAEFYLGLSEALGPLLWGPAQVDAFRRLHSEALDLGAALLWSAGPDGSTDLALRLIGQLWHYWELTEDVAEQCEVAIRLLGTAPKAPPAVLASALSAAATMCWVLGRYEDAAAHHHRALEAFRCAGSEQGMAWTTVCLAVQAAERDDTSTAQRLAEAALSSPQASLRTRLAALIALSRVAFRHADHPRALDLCHDAVGLARQLGDRWLLGIGLGNLAESMEQGGDYEAAERLLHEAIGTALQLGAQGNLVGFIESLAGVHVDQHRAELAIRMLAAADAHRCDRGLRLSSAEQERIQSIIDKARTDAGPIRFGLAWAQGQALSLDQMIQGLQIRNMATPTIGPAAIDTKLLATDLLEDVARSAKPWSS